MYHLSIYSIQIGRIVTRLSAHNIDKVSKNYRIKVLK